MTSVDVQVQLPATLGHLLSTIEGSGRLEVSKGMASEVRLEIVAHLRNLGNSRHTTADRLGGTPTGYISNLAENFDQSSTLTWDDSSATIAMRHPVLLRAFQDVTIVPTKSAALTIPVSAMAYGRRAGEFSLYLFRSKTTGNAFLALRQEDRNAPPLLMFLLVRSVTQKRDPSLFPTMDQIGTAAARGAARQIRQVISGTNSGTASAS